MSQTTSRVTLSGLKDTPIDPRDFQLGAAIKLPELSEIPNEFVFKTLGVKDQKGSDFCTAFTFCTLSELQEEVELEPSWSFAMTKSLDGDIYGYGADLRTAGMSHVKFGALEKSESPYSLDNKDQTFLRNAEVWDWKLGELAKKHQKQSLFKITGPYDHFDNIRASIHAFKEKFQGVAIGVIYGWSTKDVHVRKTTDTGGGHAMPIIGWSGDEMIVQNSYGTSSGDSGKQYLHRDIVNRNVERYGAYMLVDMPRVEAEYILDDTKREEIGALINLILSILRPLLSLLQRETLSSAGFYPIPPFLRSYFNSKPLLWRIAVYAKLVKGVDLSFIADNDVGCAESISRIVREIDPTALPVTLGTWTMLQYMIQNKRWIELRAPVNGAIAIAATGTGKPNAIGHVGVCVDGRVYSNNSYTGKFDAHYSLPAFISRYKVELGMPVRYFALVSSRK